MRSVDVFMPGRIFARPMSFAGGGRREQEDVMKLDMYLNYPGNCEEAFRFYEQHLGGRMQMMMRHGESPESRVPAEWKNAILHASIEIGGTVVRGADIPGAEAMRSAYL
ncbi:MAG TPA: hypothetical protein VLU46_14015, partial [Thermoanaerobaculia bacterium]|nr:hypothetical protein [Thermoanaerobaculia bacterium]